MASDWEERIERWRTELDLFAQLEDSPWVPLARARSLPSGRLMSSQTTNKSPIGAW